jgi:hypothetical protein
MVYYFQHAIDQKLPFAIVQVSQGSAAAEMGVIKRVATRAAQRAFPSDLNRERGVFASKNFSPGLKDLRGLHDYYDAKTLPAVTWGKRNIRTMLMPFVISISTTIERRNGLEWTASDEVVERRGDHF